MTKITLTDVASLSNEQTALTTLANNNTEIETKSDTLLSRVGTSPNQMEADLDMNSNRILNIAAPIEDTDVVRLQDIQDLLDEDYNDILAARTSIKIPVKAATTGNITLAGTQTVDGIALVAGDRVLVKNQSTASENGIYEVATGSWVRSDDFDGGLDAVRGTLVYVTQGDDQNKRLYAVSTNNPQIGTGSIVFESVETLNGRTLLTGNTEYFVDSANGNDSTGTGSALQPWATLQHFADNVVHLLDFGSYTVTVTLVAGSVGAERVYPGTTFSKGWAGQGKLVIRGSDAATPINTSIRASGSGICGIKTSQGIAIPSIEIRDLEVRSASANGLQFSAEGNAFWSNITFGNCSNAHLMIDNHLVFASSTGTYTINGDADHHIYADSGRFYPHHDVTFTGNWAGTSFIRVGFMGFFLGDHWTHTAGGFSFAGKRASIEGGGVLSANGLERDHFPGNTDITGSRGGQYLAKENDGYYGGVITLSTAGDTVAANTTSYLGMGVEIATESEASFPVPFDCIVKNLYVKSSTNPGGGEAYVITLRKDGVDTACAATIASGVTTANNTANEIAFTAGQLLSIEVTTGATASAAAFHAMIELRRLQISE